MKFIHAYNPAKAIQTVVIGAIGASTLISFGECGLANATPVFYRKITTATITIAADGDRADLYFPRLSTHQRDRAELPIVLMLPGALVDKADYSKFATQVARYGFVVVVPNNQRTLIGPNGQGFPGPIYKLVDPTKLGLMGHSFGGSAGLGATQTQSCLPGICSETYKRPPELKAGIFYGANYRNQQTQQFPPINNDGIAIGLIVGSLDGVALPLNSQTTYNQILKTPKALITVAGANHYSVTNQDNPARDPNRATLDQSIATRTIAHWSGLFLRAAMLGDRRVLDTVLRVGDELDPNVTVIR
jgi:predicted dienelactone hydrolase